MADKLLFSDTDGDTGEQLNETNISEYRHSPNATDYVVSGLGVTLNASTPSADIAAGIAAVQTGDATYEAHFDARSGVALTDSAVNEIFAVADPASGDSGLSIDARTSGTPTDPSVKIAEVDTSADTVSETNRDPAISARALSLGDDGPASSFADLFDVVATGSVTLSSGSASVDTGVSSATTATFSVYLGPTTDDAEVVAAITAASGGNYTVDIEETADTSVGNPTVEYDVVRLR